MSYGLKVGWLGPRGLVIEGIVWGKLRSILEL